MPATDPVVAPLRARVTALEVENARLRAKLDTWVDPEYAAALGQALTEEVNDHERTKAEVKRLRAALEHYVDEKNWHRPLSLSHHTEWWYYRWGGVISSRAFKRPYEVARAALGQETTP